MRLPYYTKKDWLIISILLPPTILAVNFLLFGKRYFTDGDIFLWASVLGVAIGFASWQSQILVAINLQKRYPHYHQTLKRLFTCISLYIFITTLTITAIFWGYEYIDFFHYQVNVMHFILSVIVSNIVTVVAACFHEAFAFYERWKKVTDEAEQLKRENLQSQLESLKSQVNPHFLFNSLNSLSSLISEDVQQAETFVDEMSKVYRYLLRNNEDDLTTLHAEMQFIQSYFHLLKTRYGESLQLHINIEELYLVYQLPPLTLQILVENAVKHNAMRKDQPLQIQIGTREGRLVVTNNLQRKYRQVSSNRIGLSNIAKKYKLLKQEDIMVKEDEREFAVIIPLIKDQLLS
jgi:sensor histidine kinase YesM